MELSLVETGISSTNVEVVQTLGSWATGKWLTDKFFDPDLNFRDVSVDHTTVGFDESKLVRLADSEVAAA